MCTSIKNPDEDDWKKLIRLLCYLNGTCNLFLTLEADNLTDAMWWGDATFAVHPDFKSHTGGSLSYQKGAMQTMSHKQKMLKVPHKLS